MKKKIKMRQVVDAFTIHKDRKGIIMHVFDSISDFKRKVALMKRYKEIIELYKFYGDERRKLIQRLLEVYAKETHLDVEKLKLAPLPPKVIPIYEKEHTKILDTEVEFTAFTFTDKEIENSGITISEMVKIECFHSLK